VKTYAHAGLAIFFIILGVKLYAIKVDENIQSRITQSREPLLATATKREDIFEELNNLDSLESTSTERRLAQLNETGEEDLATELSKIDQLALELEQAYLESSDNFEIISHLKDKIIKIKEAASMSINNLEEWDIETIYYLIIEERMTLEDINQLNSPKDINLNENEWKTALTYSQSLDFKKRILEYKNIEQSFNDKRLEELGTQQEQMKLTQEVWAEE